MSPRSFHTDHVRSAQYQRGESDGAGPDYAQRNWHQEDWRQNPHCKSDQEVPFGALHSQEACKNDKLDAVGQDMTDSNTGIHCKHASTKFSTFSVWLFKLVPK